MSSIILSFADSPPQDVSLLQVVFYSWGLTWVPDHKGGGEFSRKPLFTLNGTNGKRWDHAPEPREFSLRSYSRPEITTHDKLRRLARESVACATYEWFELWAERNTEVLEQFTKVDDGLLGDRAFFAFVELLMMVDEISDLFRGSNSDVWGSMECASWTDPKGPGLKLTAYLHKSGDEAFLHSGVPRQVFPAGDVSFQAQQEALIELRGWAVNVLAKFAEVVQSPAMESRFKAFFGALGRQLNLSSAQLYESLASFGRNSSFVDEHYHSLFRAKVGQVFGLLRNDDDEPELLTDVLSQWANWMREEPEGGWPIGEQFEAKANSERLKLIADEKRKSMDDLPGGPEKPVF